MRHSQPVAARIAAGFTSRGLAIAGLALLGAIHPLGISSQGGQESSTIAPLPSFAEPAISPDRSEIALVSGGDIWTVAATGGDARLLVSHEANESRPLYSPDGERLAFVSDRTGWGDIYVLSLKTGVLTQATTDDGLERLDAWSRDGRWLYFSSTSRDIAGMNDLYRVRADGGTPMLVSAGWPTRILTTHSRTPSTDARSSQFPRLQTAPARARSWCGRSIRPPKRTCSTASGSSGIAPTSRKPAAAASDTRT